MKNKILELIRSQRMLSPGDHVICALSGGIDSMALLHILLELKRELGITLSAAHFDHRLRGQESRRDAEFVQAHCNALGIPLSMGSADVAAYAKANHLSTEDAARTLRYDFLLSLNPEAKIATAHNAQDNLETLLLRLIRGTGLQGLGAIPPVRGRIIRPLLTVSRQELKQYLELRGIPHVEDSTNGSDDYLRNRIRHQVLPVLMAENPGISQAASALCLELRDVGEFITDEADSALQSISHEDGISCSGLMSLPHALRGPVLKQFLTEVPELSRQQLDAALALAECMSPSAELHFSGGWVLRRCYDRLQLHERDGNAPLQPPCPMPLQEGEIRFGAYTITSKYGLCPEQLPVNTLALTLPEKGMYVLRTRQPGDRITLPGGTKKISRYLIDKKIPVQLRDALPLLRLDGNIAAVLPLCADLRFASVPGSPSILVTVRSEDAACLTAPQPDRIKGMEEEK